jgi:hypothetical protein
MGTLEDFDRLPGGVAGHRRRVEPLELIPPREVRPVSGDGVGEEPVAKRSQRRSESNPSRTGATTRQTSSASESEAVGRDPGERRAG